MYSYIRPKEGMKSCWKFKKSFIVRPGELTPRTVKLRGLFIVSIAWLLWLNTKTFFKAIL